MTAVYLVGFIGGLLFAVRTMLLGVERPRELSATGERSFRLSPPVVVAFCVVFGLSGYLLAHRGTAGPLTALTIATLLGATAGAAAARLVRRWWKVTPEHDVDDERYVLQGFVASVVRAIDPSTDGEVAFEYGSQRRVLRARSLDHSAVSAGTEVVIERIEGDVAYVESWLEVEKRL
jgi:membrane protein implicated in regulation of membrane protease activity